MKPHALVLTLALLAPWLGACEPTDPPANPTFAKDVGPLFAAHCTRCHSTDPDPAANGRLRHEIIDGKAQLSPSFCHLDVAESTGTNCNPANPNLPNECTIGAILCAQAPANTPGGFFNTYFNPAAPGTEKPGARRMPLPPADELNDWEKTLLYNWLKNPRP